MKKIELIELEEKIKNKKKKINEKIKKKKNKQVTINEDGSSNPSSDKGYIGGISEYVEVPISGPIGCDNFPDVFPHS